MFAFSDLLTNIWGKDIRIGQGFGRYRRKLSEKLGTDSRLEISVLEFHARESMGKIRGREKYSSEHPSEYLRKGPCFLKNSVNVL